MQPYNQHIIQKQTIEINFENRVDSAGLPNHIAEVFYEKLQPQMEVLFDELFGKNYHASIGRLEIDCGVLNKKNWEQEFTEQVIRKLKEELIQVNKEEVDNKKVEENSAAEAFFFFLENGFMPWNKRIDSIAELEQLLNVDEILIARLKKLFTQKAKAADRMAWQFSKKFTSRTIAQITKDSKDELREILRLLGKFNLLRAEKQIDDSTIKRIDKHIVDAVILNLFSSDENKNKVDHFFTFLLTKVDGNEELKAEIHEIINYLRLNKKYISSTAEKDKQETIKSGVKEKYESNKDEKYEQEEIIKKDRSENEIPLDAIYINNAGLILLYPFLQNLFEHLGLTKENAWIDSTSQQLAVLVTEYLVKGKCEVEEFDLMLNKILCGIDLDEIVATWIQLNDEIKTECEVLLNEVISRWSVLKNTSIEGLRETFLQRHGKLSKVDKGWLLQVEQNAVDILLNHLPWGLGIIKLPWMKEMLFVEWT